MPISVMLCKISDLKHLRFRLWEQERNEIDGDLLQVGSVRCFIYVGLHVFGLYAVKIAGHRPGEITACANIGKLMSTSRLFDPCNFLSSSLIALRAVSGTVL